MSRAVDGAAVLMGGSEAAGKVGAGVKEEGVVAAVLDHMLLQAEAETHSSATAESILMSIDSLFFGISLAVESRRNQLCDNGACL